ncbi:hypothetical protein LINPERHAP2_LOCUS9904 [Linum perenne]
MMFLVAAAKKETKMNKWMVGYIRLRESNSKLVIFCWSAHFCSWAPFHYALFYKLEEAAAAVDYRLTAQVVMGGPNMLIRRLENPTQRMNTCRRMQQNPSGYGYPQVMNADPYDQPPALPFHGGGRDHQYQDYFHQHPSAAPQYPTGWHQDRYGRRYDADSPLSCLRGCLAMLCCCWAVEQCCCCY